MRKIALWAFLGVLALWTIAACGENPEPATTEDPGVVATSEAVSTPTRAAPKPKPAEKKWVTVATLKGTGDKQGSPFKLSGERVRLTYSVNSPDPDVGVAAFYVLDEGVNFQKDGGIPEVTVDGSEKSDTELTRDAGTYYLKVLSANTTWTVTVQELR